MKPCRIREDLARAKAKSLVRKYNISTPPVPVEEIARQEGVIISSHKTSDLKCAVALKDRKRGRYVVSVYLSGDEGRDRWSLAHELGHIKLGHFEIYDVDTLAKDKLNDAERYILDKEADIFAEELLMPAEWLREIMGIVSDFTQIEEIKKLFGVSLGALVNRLEELEISA
ncbi:MAG: ImmA/IrrE family metallo-endopeptidase [Bacillota bacterium]|nr:ImmA/IrrE family metallo-endopeptidase [Bacillota bacterium]